MTRARACRICWIACWIALASAHAVRADDFGAGASFDPARVDGFVAPHPDADWWLSGSIEASLAAQPGFSAQLSGSNSFPTNDHVAGGAIATATAGYAITPYTAIVVSGEDAVGHAFDGGKGLGAPADVDLTRGTSGVPYLGSSFVELVAPLSHAWERAARDGDHVLRSRPVRRLELRAGKLYAPSWFGDAMPRFLSGALRGDAAWEFPADEHAYTLGAILEYADPHVRVRWGEFLMPNAPRSSSYDFGIGHAREDIVEIDGTACIGRYRGSAHFGSYVNRADLGDYSEAIAAYLIEEDETPDVTKYRLPGEIKSGVYGGIDQQLPGDVLVFASIMWADGNEESFGTTETDHSARFGARWRGELWRRPTDELGAGVAIGGLADLHETYLKLGGNSALLGDGGLHYAREVTSELYYAAQLVPNVSTSLRFQLIEHPGFDDARGPIELGMLQASAAF